MVVTEVLEVLGLLDVWPVAVRTMKDVPSENGSWLVEVPGALRWCSGATTRSRPADIAYEHEGSRLYALR